MKKTLLIGCLAFTACQAPTAQLPYQPQMLTSASAQSSRPFKFAKIDAFNIRMLSMTRWQVSTTYTVAYETEVFVREVSFAYTPEQGVSGRVSQHNSPRATAEQLSAEANALLKLKVKF